MKKFHYLVHSPMFPTLTDAVRTIATLKNDFNAELVHHSRIGLIYGTDIEVPAAKREELRITLVTK